MAKVKSPLLSIGASGQIGSSQVYGVWRGVPYVRQHVVPSNPRTTGQTTTRNAFSALAALWKLMPALSQAPFAKAAQGKPLTDRNSLMKTNLGALRGQPDMTNWTGSPGAFGGFPITAIAAAAGAASGEIDVTVTSPPEPPDWTISSVIVQAIADRDPATIPTEIVVDDEDLAPTVDGDTIITLGGLVPGADYVLSGWIQWTRPDARTTYGPSLTTAVVAATP